MSISTPKVKPVPGGPVRVATAGMKKLALPLSLLALGALGLVACGGDGDEETTEAASAGRVVVTTTDTPDGRYTWEVSPTPTAETILVNFGTKPSSRMS